MADGGVARSFKDERDFWRAFARVYGGVSQHLEHELHSATGLPLTELEALYELSEAPGGRLQFRQLATRLGVSRSAVTRLVDRLERTDYVQREANLNDKRSTHVILTPAGEATLERTRELYAHVLHYALLRHRTQEGLVIYTLPDHAAGSSGARSGWYQVQFDGSGQGSR